MFKSIILAGALLTGVPYGSQNVGISISNCGNMASYACRNKEHREYYQCRDEQMKGCNYGNAETERKLSHYRSRGCSVGYNREIMPGNWQLVTWYYMPNTCKR